MNKKAKNSNTILDLLKTRTAIGVIALLAVIISAAIVVTITASGSTVEKTKYYKTIMIETGDTLWTIAEQYRDDSDSSISDYISELKKINGIEGEKIKSGNYLVVSYYSK